MLAAAWLSIAVVALERVQVEQAPPPPPGWRVIRASPPEALLELMFAVKQTNVRQHCNSPGRAHRQAFKLRRAARTLLFYGLRV
jgi:hypothetical protein